MDTKTYDVEYDRLYGIISDYIGNETTINDLIVVIIGKRPKPIPENKTFNHVTSRVGYMSYYQNALGKRIEFSLDGYTLSDGALKESNALLLQQISEEFAKASAFLKGEDA